MSMGQTAWQVFERFHAIGINLMHAVCPTATIQICTSASMSPATETRLSMLFNGTLKTYEAIQIVGHNPCSWANPRGRYFERSYAIVVNLMHFAHPAAAI